MSWQCLLHFEGNSSANAEIHVSPSIFDSLFNTYLDIGDTAYKIYPQPLTRCRTPHCRLDHQDNHLMNKKIQYLTQTLGHGQI